MSENDTGMPNEVIAHARKATGGWMAAGEAEANSALVLSVARAMLVAEARGAAKERQRLADMFKRMDE